MEREQKNTRCHKQAPVAPIWTKLGLTYMVLCGESRGPVLGKNEQKLENAFRIHNQKNTKHQMEKSTTGHIYQRCWPKWQMKNFQSLMEPWIHKEFIQKNKEFPDCCKKQKGDRKDRNERHQSNRHGLFRSSSSNTCSDDRVNEGQGYY